MVLNCPNESGSSGADENVVDTGMGSALGQGNGQFTLPLNLSGAIPHFVTAQEDGGAFAFMMTMFSPPRLDTQRQETGQIRVLWEKSVQPYVLQTSASLGAGAVWSSVQAQPIPQCEHFYIDVAAGASAQFFRLSQQP